MYARARKGKHFRGKPLDGEWWSAERPADHFRGILQLDNEHHASLTLRGSEDQLKSLPCEHESRTFYGQLSNPYTYKVTLCNTQMVQGPSVVYPKQPGRETTAKLRTNNILSGAHIASEDHPFLSG